MKTAFASPSIWGQRRGETCAHPNQSFFKESGGKWTFVDICRTGPEMSFCLRQESGLRGSPLPCCARKPGLGDWEAERSRRLRRGCLPPSAVHRDPTRARHCRHQAAQTTSLTFLRGHLTTPAVRKKNQKNTHQIVAPDTSSLKKTLVWWYFLLCLDNQALELISGEEKSHSG